MSGFGFGFGFSPHGALLNYLPTMIADSDVVAIYDRTNPDGVEIDANGKDAVYYDLKFGKNVWSEEITTGSTVPYTIYKITACTTNNFFTGCKVGDVYIAKGVRNFSSDNRALKMLGNHLTQPWDDRRPTAGVFAGSPQCMKTAPFTYNQPAAVYIAFSQKLWTINSRIFSGNISSYPMLVQSVSSPGIVIDASGGAFLKKNELPINEVGIVRAVFNGVNSKFIINNNQLTIENAGTANLGGFTIASSYTGESGFSNIQFDGGVLRKEVVNEDIELKTYNYLNRIYSIGLPDTRNTFNTGKMVIGLDGSTSYVHAALQIFINKNVKSTIFAIPEDLLGYGGLMSWGDLQLWKDAGMDIQDHPSQANLGLTVEQVVAIYQSINDQFTAHGFDAPKHTAYMANLYDANVLTAVSQMRLSGRTGTIPDYSQMEFRKPKQGFTKLLGTNIGTLTYAAICAKIDYASTNKCCFSTYFHGIDAPGADNGLSASELEAIIDYAIGKGVEIITHSEMYDLMQH